MTDIIVLDAKPIEVQTYLPPTPRNIGLRMQYQESNLWCWIAVATSISHFYNPFSTWTQCQVMTVIGHNINGFPADTSACPRSQVVAANPPLAAALANPYDKSAEYILDNFTYMVDRRYLKSGGVTDALKTTGNYDSYHGPLLLDQIAAQVNAGRPVVVSITWLDGSGTHFVVVAGVLDDSLLILDPIAGQSVVRFGDFPGTYFNGPASTAMLSLNHDRGCVNRRVVESNPT